jgi:L-Lysine epsilon oxidase N-terminal
MSERAQTSETKIVRAAIYPAIGIARVGNSESEYFLAPEVADPPPEAPGFYRDPTGALKRQAVRFATLAAFRRQRQRQLSVETGMCAAAMARLASGACIV